MHLLPYTAVLLTVSATYLAPRAIDPCTQDAKDFEAVQLDGATTDGTAGIGAEFESVAFYFTNIHCSVEDTNAARGKIIAGRTGTHWELKADSTSDQGKVNAEYVLDGTQIKVGSGDGASVGRAWADDLITWKPWTGTPPNTVDIGDSNCNPWRIATTPRSDPKKLPWSPQITTSMPLEALYSLMKENQASKEDPNVVKNILDGTNFNTAAIFVVVSQDYFQSNPNGLDQSQMTDDVLAFCSLVLTYAKNAKNPLRTNQSPKLFSPFMPRTEFITLFGIVKAKLKGDLFELFNNLACYKRDNGKTQIDTEYCTGPLHAPVSNDKFGKLEYENQGTTPPTKMNIKDWITGIDSGKGVGEPPVDALSNFDRSNDKSIGGRGTTMEKMYQSDRSAPLIEFRNLDDIQTSGVEQFMKDVDTAIQALHAQFANPPTKRKRDAPASCVRSFAADATSSVAAVAPAAPSPIVVAPVDPPSQPSCVPPPTGAIRDSHEGALQRSASAFCSLHAHNPVQKGPINIADTISASTIIAGHELEGDASPISGLTTPPSVAQDDVYDISIRSVPDCTPKGDYNLATPVAKNQCADILHSAWKNCNNKGRGGAITAGCLVYRVSTKF